MLSQESVAGESMANCGQWHLEREIGHGVYGVVFLADGPDGERAAVKVCRRDAIGEERYERELRGAKLYRTIPSQEGLVRMREFVEESWGFYAVMDLADDEFGDRDFALDEYRPKTLSDVIEGEKALPLDECVKLGMVLAKGLATLQRHHLLHRDIKPGNVIYVGGRPVLSDPGLLVEESEATSLVGTPGYVPPENFTDAASDIYSLGLTLKAASFGRRLEDLDKGPALEADTGAKFFPAWWRILNKATDPVPSRRYQSAKALLKEVEKLRIGMVIAKFSWVYKVVIGVLFLATIAYGYALYRERKGLEPEIKRVKQFFAIQQALNDTSAQNDTAWLSFSGSYYCRTDESHRQRLKRVEEKDPVRAAAMRGILVKMQEIDKKGEENNRRIKILRDQNMDKGNAGASERYNQAEILSMENAKLVKAWLSLLERFILIEDETKEYK
jgi:serine/threonine protein kinase